jgi:hypothetical protein
MPELICPSLNRLGSLLLREALSLTEDSCASTGSAAIAKAERNLLRVNKLIGHHRSTCLLCQFNEAKRLRHRTSFRESGIAA